MFGKFSNWISSGFIRWLTTDRPYMGIPLCDFDRIRYEIRPCDVLLIEGRSRISDIIRSITQSSWSHAALYIGRLHDIEDPKMRNLLATHWQGSPDTQLIIEGMMGQGTIVNSISQYEHDHIRVCRPRGLSRRDAQEVVAFLIRKLGTDYDVRQILDLARFLLPWSIMPRRLRSQLFEGHPTQSTKTVCSSMIAEAFASVEFPILPLVKKHAEHGIELITRNPKLYTPRDFDYSPYFDIIKYPFVEFADYAMYRKLPWNREGLISHDEVGIRSFGPMIGEEQVKVKKIEKSALNRFKDRFGRHTKEIDLISPLSKETGTDSEFGLEPEQSTEDLSLVTKEREEKDKVSDKIRDKEKNKSKDYLEPLDSTTSKKTSKLDIKSEDKYPTDKPPIKSKQSQYSEMELDGVEDPIRIEEPDAPDFWELNSNFTSNKNKPSSYTPKPTPGKKT